VAFDRIQPWLWLVLPAAGLAALLFLRCVARCRSEWIERYRVFRQAALMRADYARRQQRRAADEPVGSYGPAGPADEPAADPNAPTSAA
jgi:hypothetical protein